MPTLLFEIGSEELPASAVRSGLAQLPRLVEVHLGVAPARIYATPRRLAVRVEGLPERTPDEWAKGPPVELREKAAAGFAKRHGVAVDELEERDGVLGVTVPGKALAEVLPERLDAILRGLSFPKTMRWDDSGLRYPRPVRWQLARLDAEAVEGYGTVTYGHRFAAGAVDVAQPDDYEETLRGANVEPDAAEREHQIRSGLDALGEWSDPLGKLAEVVHLVEWPRVQDGTFDERFLSLPERVVVTAMQSHQRYFPLGGNRFAFVANGGDPEVVRLGNERVLAGRLEDASFTFERDVKRGIAELVRELPKITFFAEAGSFADKTERLAKLVEELGGGEATREAARLAKADQAAELVREFPDLEGYIGAEYARLAGYPEAVAKAIEEQYLPDAASGPLPETEAGKILAAAEKIDNLRVAFGLGHKPTGSRDPYGLRRAAIGVLRLATEGGLPIDRAAAFPEEELRDFVEERLENLLDVPVEFVRAARKSGVRELGAVAALARFLAALEDERLEPVHTVFTRASRIAGSQGDGRIDPALLVEDAEVQLASAVEAEEARIAREVEQGDFDSAWEAAAGLAPVVERFFDEVLVMAEDAALRTNRLRLLAELRNAVGVLGDFSEIPRQ
jgi:glycyl-tRNA synthetase beta chain